MLNISVVICAFTADRWNDLTAALKSLEDQTHPAHEVVLVIDHNEELFARAREQWTQIQVVENAGRQGLSDARNTGMSVCSGDVVAFLDDDAIAADDWLAALAAAYDDETVIAVGGAVRPNWLAGRPRWFPREFDWVVGCAHSGMPEVATPVRNVIGAGMSFRRFALDRLGGFSYELGRVGSLPVGCEETEMCIRALRTFPGTIVLYDPAAAVDHSVPPTRATLRYFVDRCRSEGRSKAVLSRLAGAGDALSSERTYVSNTLPAGVALGLRDALRGDLSGIARAGAIVLGLVATTLGYAAERVRAPLRRVRRRRSAPARTPHDASRPLRVLMVTPRYPPDMGGVERHVVEVSSRLHALGCDVTVLCTDRSGRNVGDDERDGVHVRRVRAWPTKQDFYLAPAIWPAMRAGEWDVVHVQSYHTFVAPLAMLRARVLGVPFVLTFHGGGHSSRVRHSFRPVQRRLLGPLVKRAARLVAIARFEIPLYTRDFGVPADKFVLIPNGSDVESAPSGEVAERTGPPVIASVGRLERYKGHHRVLDALPYVLKVQPDATLWIVGSGPQAGALQRQAEQLGVADHVVIRSVPSDEPDAMRALLDATTLVVSMSDFETQPLAALEALSAGCGLLVADTSGLKELADSGAARAIPLDSTPQAVAEAIVTELTATRSTVRPELTTWDDCAADLLALYREVACAS